MLFSITFGLFLAILSTFFLSGNPFWFKIVDEMAVFSCVFAGLIMATSMIFSLLDKFFHISVKDMEQSKYPVMQKKLLLRYRIGGILLFMSLACLYSVIRYAAINSEEGIVGTACVVIMPIIMIIIGSVEGLFFEKPDTEKAILSIQSTLNQKIANEKALNATGIISNSFPGEKEWLTTCLAEAVTKHKMLQEKERQIKECEVNSFAKYLFRHSIRRMVPSNA